MLTKLRMSYIVVGIVIMQATACTTPQVSQVSYGPFTASGGAVRDGLSKTKEDPSPKPFNPFPEPKPSPDGPGMPVPGKPEPPPPPPPCPMPCTTFRESPTQLIYPPQEQQRVRSY